MHMAGMDPDAHMHTDPHGFMHHEHRDFESTPGQGAQVQEPVHHFEDGAADVWKQSSTVPPPDYEQATSQNEDIPLQQLYVAGHEPKTEKPAIHEFSGEAYPLFDKDAEEMQEDSTFPAWKRSPAMVDTPLTDGHSVSSAPPPAPVSGENTLIDATGNPFQVTRPLEISCFDDKGTRRCLPSLIYIGVGHAGSTSLFKALSTHPQLEPNTVYHSGKPGRETWFFNDLWDLQWDIEQARSEYAALFPVVPSSGLKTSFEKTPTYWRNLAIPARMARVVPNATILMLLRDPVTWFHSRFYPISEPHIPGEKEVGDQEQRMQQISEDDLKSADESFLFTVQSQGVPMCEGLAAGVKEFLKHYPRTSLHVELTEDFSHEPIKVLQRIETKIGLTPYAWDLTALKQRWHVSKRPNVSKNVRAAVREGCRASMKELEAVLGIELHKRWGE